MCVYGYNGDYIVITCISVYFGLFNGGQGYYFFFVEPILNTYCVPDIWLDAGITMLNNCLKEGKICLQAVIIL
jgi:hypothetical protein